MPNLILGYLQYPFKTLIYTRKCFNKNSEESEFPKEFEVKTYQFTKNITLPPIFS